MLVDPRAEMILREVSPAPAVKQPAAEFAVETIREGATTMASCFGGRREVSSDGEHKDSEWAIQAPVVEDVDRYKAATTGNGSISFDTWDPVVDGIRSIEGRTLRAMPLESPGSKAGSVAAERDAV